MSPGYWFPKPYADLVARLRVPTGFLLVLAFVLLSHPDPPSLARGFPLSVFGLFLRGWAAGNLRKNQNLATGGPYAYIRNPLYVGTLMVAAGLVIASRQWSLAALFGAVFLFIYLPVIELEEQHLRNLFPDYAAYAERVPMLIPYRPPIASKDTFRWSTYLRNQEYQALLGLLAGIAYLLVRAVRG